MRQKIIIGIHGLGNKPSRRVLEKWWRWSLCDGLEQVSPHDLRFNFELVYWAHYYHSRPLSIRVKDTTSPFYISEPYVPESPETKDHSISLWRKVGLDIIEKILDTLFLKNRLISLDMIGDWIIRKKFKDLDFYYHDIDDSKSEKDALTTTLVRKELAAALRRHRKKDILLIAHSMGSIVAYDTLTQVVPDIKIHTFVTMGSPLGLPAVMKKIFEEQDKDFRKEKKVSTPENIRDAWLNFSDLHDNVALNYNLADDYKPNSHGVAPQDFIVNNDYEVDGAKNPHKSYGYLRTTEVAEALYEFLSEKPSLLQRVVHWMRDLFEGEILDR